MSGASGAFDYLGEFGRSDAMYTLTVKEPPRPPSRWLPSIFNNKPSTKKNLVASGHKLSASDNNPNLDNFVLDDIKNLPTKVVVIQSALFPWSRRCQHVEEEYQCKEGCYFLEKGGDVKRFTCDEEDCEGHVYTGPVLKDVEGKSCFDNETGKGKICFGKKGERMVCVTKPPKPPKPTS